MARQRNLLHQVHSGRKGQTFKILRALGLERGGKTLTKMAIRGSMNT